MKTFKILSIDGGGIRGVYPAQIINQMEEDLGIDITKTFDLIAGTSTGSIIAAALGVGYLSDYILEMYQKDGPEIFSKAFLGGVVSPKYDNKILKEKLENIFQDLTFKDAKTRLLITATNVSKGTPWTFKSTHLEDDTTFKISDAVLASCCAPLYFNPYVINDQLLADGGLWANNPALAAFVEAIGKNILVKRYNIRIISIGTGINDVHYPIEWQDKSWGATRWGTSLIDMIFNMQSLSVEKYLTTIMLKEQYLRINFELKDKIPMDDVKAIPSLIERATNDYYKNREQILEILIT